MAIGIEVGEPWQRAEENKVGDCQVDEVNVAALPLLQAKHVTKYNYKVARKPNGKLDGIRWC